MRFKDLKISTKLGLAFGIILLMLIIIGVVSFNRNFKYAKAANMAQFMLAKEVDNFKWAGDVQKVFTQNLKELEVQTDHTKCSFGSWYYNFIISKDFMALPKELKEIIMDIDKPHEELHKTVIEIKNNWEQKHEGLQNSLLLRLDDHRKWSAEVLSTLLKRKEIKVETDPRMCAFGKWLESEECKQYLKSWPEFKERIDNVKVHHDILHQSIITINEQDSFNNKMNIFNNITAIELEKVVSYFQEIIALENSIVNSNDKALEIFNIQTIPALNNVKNRMEVAINVLESEKKSAYNQMLITVVILIFIGVIIVIGMIFYAIKGIAKPITNIVKVANNIADGDLGNKIIEIDSKDEIGMLSSSFKKISDSLNDTLGQVNSAVEQVASGSNQVAQASQSLSQGATEQASSLEEITSSITEISSQAKQNADNAVQASGLSKQAMDNAESGNKQMQELVVAMGDINKSADEIKRIVKIIDEIAFQTNLLALNANVEAARAGKYGKGFAVVAEEVRNLASRSGESVQETTQMVEEAIKNIQTGNNLVETTSKQLEEIVNGASKAADLVEEIANASKEQTQGLDQINQGLGQIDQVTQSNTANAEESASAAEELASQAQELQSIISKFKLADKKLIEKEVVGSESGFSSDLKKKIWEEKVKTYDYENNSHLNKLHEINKVKTETVQQPKISYVDYEDIKDIDIKAHNPVVNSKEVIKLDDQDFGKY